MAQTDPSATTLTTLTGLAGDLIRDVLASLVTTTSEDPWPAIIALRETARSLTAVADVMAAIARRTEG
jgi:hypothetical protein